ncbi:MAG: alpha/beta hydrolase [Proteobacteria bacterium]|nr:alpha/beta hydrolase [Pseudomonadota bacterium]
MSIMHPLAAEDAPVAAAMRLAIAPHKGEPMGSDARPMFDAMMAAAPAAEGVRFEPGEVGGVPGWWCRPPGADPGRRLLYLHGGGYGLGSAVAFRNLASQIAARAKANAFLPDYRLAPEHPFPAAIEDVVAAYRGLFAQGTGRIVVAGDSAGGGLTLALLPILRAEGVLPAGAAVMSPWTDLGLTGASLESRADADPIFTRGMLQALADSYVQGSDKTDPRMSPIHAALDGLPPIRIDVGDDEVLLDDSVRFAARAAAARVDVSLSVWAGMPHVFQSSLGHLRAADQSLDAIGAFLSSRLDVPADDATPSTPAERV